MHRPRLATLIGGLALVGLGVWILLDASGDLTISFEALGPILAAIGGVILLASGLEDRT
ncbi:MAG: hypothetical protein ACJ762_14775 [Solirubrobacteraceae bacterium]